MTENLPPLEWKTEKRRLGDLIKWDENPRHLSKDQAKRLKQSIIDFGYSQLYEIEPDNTIVDGHQRDEVMLRMDEFGADIEIEVRVSNRKLTKEERKKYIVMKHNSAMGDWNWDDMKKLYEYDELVGWGFESQELIDQGFKESSTEFTDIDEILEEKTEIEIPEMELQPYESYDYLVLVFRNRLDWLRIIELLDIGKAKVTLSDKVEKVGIGRAIFGERVTELLEGDDQ